MWTITRQAINVKYRIEVFFVGFIVSTFSLRNGWQDFSFVLDIVLHPWFLAHGKSFPILMSTTTCGLLKLSEGRAMPFFFRDPCRFAPLTFAHSRFILSRFTSVTFSCNTRPFRRHLPLLRWVKRQILEAKNLKDETPWELIRGGVTCFLRSVVHTKIVV